MPLLAGKPFDWHQVLSKPIPPALALETVSGSKQSTAAVDQQTDGAYRTEEDNRQCWQIRFTKEIFLNYDEFFAAMQKYRQPIWTCKETGQQGLTFEQALLSEQKAKQQQKIPRVLQKQILERVQFSTIVRIDNLTDHIVAELSPVFFEGEELTLDRSAENVALGSCQVFVVKSVGPLKQQYPERYMVRLADGGDDAKPVVAEASKLSRQRNVISKQQVRTFIRESASKESHLNSPWTIKPELASKFGISSTPPEELWDEKHQRLKIKRHETETLDGKSVKRRKSSSTPVIELLKPKYPIEDSELPHYIARMKPSHRHPEMDTSAVPRPSHEFSIPETSVKNLLSSWDFLFVFAKPLGLYPFTLDDFEYSLRCQESCPIIDQIHYRLLSLAANYTQSLISKLKLPRTRGPSAVALRKIKGGDNIGISEDEFEDDGTALVEDESPEIEVNIEGTGSSTGPAATISSEINATFPERWWTWSVKEDQWEKALTAYLLHLATIESVPRLKSIIRTLTGGLDAESNSRNDRLDFSADERYWADGTVDFRETYPKLSVEEKLEILNFLINESIVPSQKCRKYIEECTQSVQEYRKEKRELDVKLRDCLGALGLLDKTPSDDAQKSDPSKQQEKTQDTDVEVDEEEEDTAAVGNTVDLESTSDEGTEDEEPYSSDYDDDDNEYSKQIREIKRKLEQFDADTQEVSARVSRQEKVKLQQQLRDLEDNQRQEQVRRAREQAKQKHAETRVKIEERKRLNADITKLEKRDNILDREIRLHSAVLHLKPLGRDRFWNNYFWMDGYGSGISGLQDHSGAGGHAGPTRHLLPYGCGRLFVEGSGHPAFLGHISGGSARQISGKRKVTDMSKLHQHPEGWLADPFVTLPLGFAGVPPGDAVGKNWLSEGEWAYYETPEEIDEFLSWLNPKGIREQHLKGVLTKYYDMITAGLRKRQQDLTASTLHGTEVKSRPSTRHHAAVVSEPFFLYQNRWSKF